jgi:hypothetical protein
MLKETWQGDYQQNVNLVTGLLASQFPESVHDLLISARLPNGKAMFNSPEVMVAFADMARKINPAATVVPGVNNPAQAIVDEIANLEKEMGTPEWYKDTAKQKRYQDLLEAKERMDSQ